MTVYIFFHQFICLQNSKQGIENWLTDCICWAYYLRWKEQRIRILTHLHMHTGAYSANQPDIQLKERDDRGKKIEKKNNTRWLNDRENGFRHEKCKELQTWILFIWKVWKRQN